MNLSKAVKVSMIEAGATTAGSELVSDSIDMKGFEGCFFVGRFATVNATNTAKVTQSAVTGSGHSDLLGTALSPGDDDDSFLIDVYRPRERFLRLVITRSGADTVTGDVYAIQYGPKAKPTTHAATIDAELHVSPAEGVA